MYFIFYEINVLITWEFIIDLKLVVNRIWYFGICSYSSQFMTYMSFQLSGHETQFV